jgi:hypothetical protein
MFEEQLMLILRALAFNNRSILIRVVGRRVAVNHIFELHTMFKGAILHNSGMNSSPSRFCSFLLKELSFLQNKEFYMVIQSK